MLIESSQLFNDLKDGELYVEWVDDMTGKEILSIQEYGPEAGYPSCCNNGVALEAMENYGNKILSFIRDIYGEEIPTPSSTSSRM